MDPDQRRVLVEHVLVEAVLGMLHAWTCNHGHEHANLRIYVETRDQLDLLRGFHEEPERQPLLAAEGLLLGKHGAVLAVQLLLCELLAS